MRSARPRPSSDKLAHWLHGIVTAQLPECMYGTGIISCLIVLAFFIRRRVPSFSSCSQPGGASPPLPTGWLCGCRRERLGLKPPGMMEEGEPNERAFEAWLRDAAIIKVPEPAAPPPPPPKPAGPVRGPPS